MCGIAGIVGSSSEPQVVERMVQRLVHRGPDDSGTWGAPGVRRGHTRLSILDLSDAGHQPMTFGPYTITYNGEIYNFRELRSKLPGPFRSDCDTEVLLHLYARDRDKCVDALCGMFSFAVWDADAQRLFAARDRLGIKPFFYRVLPDGIAFASEIKALLELGRPSVDSTALVDRASMAHSLEVRPPLFDHRRVEFALSLDTRLLRDVEGNRGKLILRSLMDGLVPSGLFARPKRGFNLPIKSWVRRHPGLVRGALDRLARAGVIRRSLMPNFNHDQLWMLLVLDRWNAKTGAL